MFQQYTRAASSPYHLLRCARTARIEARMVMSRPKAARPITCGLIVLNAKKNDDKDDGDCFHLNYQDDCDADDALKIGRY